MGVNSFLLDRRTARLLIGGSSQTVGTLRRFFKLTELDEERAAELDAAARITPSPAAAMLMDITEPSSDYKVYITRHRKLPRRCYGLL